MLASWCVKKWDLSLSVLSFQPHWGAYTPLCQDSSPWQAAEFPAWNNRMVPFQGQCVCWCLLPTNTCKSFTSSHTYIRITKLFCTDQSCCCHSNTKELFYFYLVSIQNNNIIMFLEGFCISGGITPRDQIEYKQHCNMIDKQGALAFEVNLQIHSHS